jgi:hypothetical protein
VLALAVVVLAALALSGGTVADPPVPRGFPGVLPAFWIGVGDRDRPVAVRGNAADTAGRRDQGWLARARPLDPAAPRWAWRIYRRSLLVLQALTDRRGAAVAGARGGWGYVWPRDAGAVAIAFASAGYRAESRRIARFLLGLDLGAAARFYRSGEPVDGRGPQGDAAGWAAAAARAAGIAPEPTTEPAPRDRADYQEGDAGEYLGNAIASGASLAAFETDRGLVRTAGDPESGLDSVAAWAVRPFSRPALYPAVRRTLLSLTAGRGSRYGLVPSEGWRGGDDPWTAPAAWTAWSLATLWQIDRRAGRSREAATDRRAALDLMTDLRRSSTPAGLLPERVDARTGAPTSTTPLAWSHAFAILAIRELWPEAQR